MFGDWKVQVVRNIPGYMNSRIYLYQQLQGQMQFITHKGETVTVKHGDATNRDDHYFAEMDDDQLQALADALADKGIKTRNDHKNERLLEATQAHLQDMRSLVFEPAVDKTVVNNFSAPKADDE